MTHHYTVLNEIFRCSISNSYRGWLAAVSPWFVVCWVCFVLFVFCLYVFWLKSNPAICQDIVCCWWSQISSHHCLSYFLWAKVPVLQYKVASQVSQFRQVGAAAQNPRCVQEEAWCGKRISHHKVFASYVSEISPELYFSEYSGAQNAYSSVAQSSCCILMQKYLITNKLCTIRIRTKVTVMKISLYWIKFVIKIHQTKISLSANLIY